MPIKNTYSLNTYLRTLSSAFSSEHNELFALKKRKMFVNRCVLGLVLQFLVDLHTCPYGTILDFAVSVEVSVNLKFWRFYRSKTEDMRFSNVKLIDTNATLGKSLKWNNSRSFSGSLPVKVIQSSQYLSAFKPKTGKNLKNENDCCKQE